MEYALFSAGNGPCYPMLCYGSGEGNYSDCFAERSQPEERRLRVGELPLFGLSGAIEFLDEDTSRSLSGDSPGCSSDVG